MVRIMLACAQGLSTSLLVTKMQQAAEADKIDATIWATSYMKVEEAMGEFDVLLLGPQVRHAFDSIKQTVGDTAKVDIIKMQDYGRCDGAAVLKYALGLLEG